MRVCCTGRVQSRVATGRYWLLCLVCFIGWSVLSVSVYRPVDVVGRVVPGRLVWAVVGVWWPAAGSSVGGM